MSIPYHKVCECGGNETDEDKCETCGKDLTDYEEIYYCDECYEDFEYFSESQTHECGIDEHNESIVD